MSVVTGLSKLRYPRVCVLQVTFTYAPPSGPFSVSNFNVFANGSEFDFTNTPGAQTDRKLLISCATVGTALRMTFTSAAPVLRATPRAMVSPLLGSISGVVTVDDAPGTDYTDSYDLRINGAVPANTCNMMFLLTFES